jgi:diguanylate cyclase (GGDEF)-like protein
MNISYTYSPWLVPLFISTGILFLLWGYAYRKREENQARTFMWLMVSLLIWTICYILGLASDDLAGKIFWLRMKYLGSVSAPIIWFMFSLQFTQNENVLTPRVKAAFWSFYLITLGVVFTSSWQTWMWGRIWIEPGLLEEQVTHGWYFWFYLVVSYLLILVSAWLYIRFLWVVPAIYQKQSSLMAVGSLIPLLGRIALDAFGLNLIPQLDEVILFFLASSLIFSVALFRYSVLSIMPVAYAQVFQSMQIGIIVLDPQKRVIELNPSAQKMFSVNSSNYQGIPMGTLWPPINDLEMESETTIDLEIPATDVKHCYQLRTTTIHNRSGRPSGYLILSTDITQQKKDAIALEKLATEDGLTSLLNRRTFMAMAEIEHQRVLRYHHSYAVILFDLDHFKRVNDIHGHQCGDEVLQEVAKRCKANLRSMDLFGRYGGEEFVILVPEIDAQATLAVAEKIRRVISDTPIPLEKANQSLKITASIGVAIFTSEEEAGLNLETMLSRSDKMLYVSKKNGRNRVTVWSN